MSVSPILAPLSVSNPASTLGVPLTKGIETYFQAINDSGDINGWKIKLVEKDNNYMVLLVRVSPALCSAGLHSEYQLHT